MTITRIATLAMVASLLAAGCGDEGTTTAGSTEAKSTDAAGGTTIAPPEQATTTTAEQAAGGGGNGGAGGGRPEPGSGSGADTAVIAAAAVLTEDGTPGQACGEFVTEAFIRDSYGGEANCVAARQAEALARSIVVGPGVDDASSSIVVEPIGGPYDGAKVTVALVEEDGGFRVDRLRADVPAGP